MTRETSKLIDAYISECESIFDWKNENTDKPMKFTERVKEHGSDIEKIVTIIFILTHPMYRQGIYKKYKPSVSDIILSSGKTITEDTENIDIILRFFGSMRGGCLCYEF